jgi:hypothetical protein
MRNMDTWLAFVVVAVIGAGAAFVAVAYRKKWDWTGFAEGQRVQDAGAGTGGPKKLWDWMQLLVVPLALAAVGFAFNAAQSDRDYKRDERRADVDNAIADRRSATDRSIAADNRREDTLQAYLHQMSDLMLQRKLLRSRHESEQQILARTLTLTALRRLDGEQRGLLVRFIAEAGLIEAPQPKINLTGANLREARLDGARLQHSMLPATDLRGAHLRLARSRTWTLVRLISEAQTSASPTSGAQASATCALVTPRSPSQTSKQRI